MTTRDDIAQLAHSFVGTVQVSGYDQPNPFSKDLARPTEAWCGDYVTDVYKRAGLLLLSMQPGCRTGFAYCPDAAQWAHQHGAVRWSWQAEPGDIALFDWNGDGVADHTEIVRAYSNGQLITDGGNSGPDGGVNEHTWAAPENVGNKQILLVINADKCVDFTQPPVHHAPAPPPSGNWYTQHRLLMLKSRWMRGTDVHNMQDALINNRFNVGRSGADGIFGPATRDALIAFQKAHGLQPDGIRGPHTWDTLGA